MRGVRMRVKGLRRCVSDDGRLGRGDVTAGMRGTESSMEPFEGRSAYNFGCR